MHRGARTIPKIRSPANSIATRRFGLDRFPRGEISKSTPGWFFPGVSHRRSRSGPPAVGNRMDWWDLGDGGQVARLPRPAAINWPRIPTEGGGVPSRRSAEDEREASSPATHTRNAAGPGRRAAQSSGVQEIQSASAGWSKVVFQPSKNLRPREAKEWSGLAHSSAAAAAVMLATIGSTERGPKTMSGINASTNNTAMMQVGVSMKKIQRPSDRTYIKYQPTRNT